MSSRLLWGVLPLLIALLSPACARRSPPPTEQAAVVTRGAIVVAVSVAGFLEAATTVEVKSRASGQVSVIHVQDGQFVDAGHPLADLDPESVLARRDEAVAAVREAALQVEASELQIDVEALLLKRQLYEGKRQLAAGGLLSREELAESEIDHRAYERLHKQQLKLRDIATVRLQGLQATLRKLEAETRFTTIRAPIEGYVIKRHVEVGSGVTSISDSAQGGTVLFDIGTLADVVLVGQVTAMDASRLGPRAHATVSLDSHPAKSLPARLTHVALQGVRSDKSGVSSFEVRIALDTVPEGVRPGTPGTAQVVVAEKADAVIVPAGCVHYDGRNNPYVLTGTTPRSIRKSVSLGLVSNSMAELTSGLEVGKPVLECGTP